MPDSLNSSVNQHYLNKVMDLAEVMPVVATEDIFDARGMKLIAKGARVSRTLQEKLILHKLRKPIESSMSVEAGVDSDHLMETATRVIDTSLPLRSILQTTGVSGFTPMKILSSMAFGNAMSMMLTISERDGSQAFEHAVVVSLLSICMARKLRLSEQDQVVAGLAGLLHDIGELYIDPIYLARGKRLLPREWAHVVVHPRIGQMLINELESYPPGVGRAVAEHHERLDGSGYPRHAASKDISMPGQTLSVAEMIAGLLSKDHPLERAELALKIIPGEHPHGLLSAISGALNFSRQKIDAAALPPANGGEDIERLFWRISSSLENAQKLLSGSTVKSQITKEVLVQTVVRIQTIQRACISSGIDVYLNQAQIFAESDDHSIIFEKDVATREIQWRLRGIARDIALHSGAQDENSIFAPLINLLDDQPEAALEIKPAEQS
jgi:response regulator RpfG family c-di-GMP phosphodiesterase